jgi:uncharacterized protein (UPF0332 family)
MNPFDDDLRKANEFYTVARLCFEQGYYNSCANRAYYAMYRAAFAALKKFVSSAIIPEPSNHKGLIGKFTNELIHRRKVFPSQFGDYLHKNLQARIIGDYKLDDVSQRDARRCLNYAQEFLAKVEEVVKP